jgi:hypothetical protein
MRVIDEDTPMEWGAIPPHMRASLLHYVNDRLQPGHFLTSVLSNDLYGACSRADDHNRTCLYDYVVWLSHYAPSSCWGSTEKVSEWLTR